MKSGQQAQTEVEAHPSAAQSESQCAGVSMPSAKDGLAVGAAVALRKPHACGGQEWTVARVGAEVGLVCRTCERRVLLPRAEVRRRLRPGQTDA
jgi:hypothetical protein